MNLGIGEIILLSVTILAFFLPVIALIDIIRNNFHNNDKLIWVIVVIFLHVLGTILYFAMGRKRRII